MPVCSRLRKSNSSAIPTRVAEEASGTVQLFQSWNSGSQFATTDMLTAAWNFLAGTILPEAAGLAIVGAIFNYARHRPFMPLVGSGLAFLSVSAIWKLVQAMAG